MDLVALDLDRYLDLPRVAGLALSPDGRRLVTTVAALAPDRTKYVTAVWELDPAGQHGPPRLTRSAAGESAPAFLPDGGLLFASPRTDPQASAAGPDPAVAEPDTGPADVDGAGVPALWLLPAGGGEARRVAAMPAGIPAAVVARSAGTVVFRAELFPGVDGAQADRERGGRASPGRGERAAVRGLPDPVLGP